VTVILNQRRVERTFAFKPLIFLPIEKAKGVVLRGLEAG
jgi:hypothetical protein